MARFLIVVAVSIAFGALSVVALMDHGFVGIFEAAFANTATAQVFFDLVISCFIASGWMIRDARRRGHNPWPFVAMVPVLGSIGVLAYLWVREWPWRARDGQAPTVA